MVDIILASGSPRRSDILKQVGIDFTVKTSKVKEDFADNLTPEQVVMELAARKCEAVFSEVLPEKDTVVISADTIVVYEDEILGKPKDEDDAYNTLKRLSGHIHQVYTGVTMTYFINGKFRIDHSVFKQYIDEYIQCLKQDIELSKQEYKLVDQMLENYNDLVEKIKIYNKTYNREMKDLFDVNIFDQNIITIGG